MRTLVVVAAALALGLSSCRPSDEDIRKIVREEMTAAMKKQVVTSASAIGPYSPAVRVGGFLFLSGQIALDPQTGQLHAENIEAETRQVLDNLNGILRSQGYDSSNVIMANVYLKNMNDYQRMNLIYGGYFQEGDYPARVTVETSNLPRQANIEISVVAYKQ